MELTSANLTCTITTRTMVMEALRNPVDASVKKLLDNLRQLEVQKWSISRDIDAIRRSLAMLDITPTGIKESTYAATQPFHGAALTDACMTVLKDHAGQWMSKAQVEYLLVRGGYEFTAKDARNSIDVTLRRLAEAGSCEAERTRGAHGNRYMCKEKKGWDTPKSEDHHHT